MSRDEFIQQFMVTFLSSWVSVHYDEACSYQKHEMLREPPVEDAEFLARCAWNECCKHLDSFPGEEEMVEEI